MTVKPVLSCIYFLFALIIFSSIMDESFEKDSYAPPQIEVVEFILEKGFANSIQTWETETW